MSEAPATELEAVNVILMNMGETPVDSLTGDLPLDAYKAQQVLHEISRGTQNRGWHWNREIVTLTPDAESKIAVPSNTLSVKRYGYGAQVVLRDGYLYRIERNNNGFTFDGNVEVVITYFLPYDNIPPIGKEYITAKASRIFQARELGDELLLRQGSAEEQVAWARLRAEENVNAKRSLKESMDVQMITDRSNAPVIRR